MNHLLDELILLPKVDNHMMTEETKIDSAIPEWNASLWDHDLLPLEVAETTSGVICTIWLNQVTTQEVRVDCGRAKLLVRVLVSADSGNDVTYVCDVDLPTAVDNNAAHMLLNGAILTITMPRAHANIFRQFIDSAYANLLPHYNTLSLQGSPR